jgi:hypothetical protein
MLFNKGSCCMRRHIHRCRQGVLAVVVSLLIGSLLLSACGRADQSAAPATAIPISIATAPALGAATSAPAAPFILDGAIEQLAQERWVVAGTPVVLDTQTTIVGAPALGAMAHIQGELSTDAVLLARTISVEALMATSTVAPTPTTAPTSTPSPIPPPTATPLPPGTVVNINGVIENISITNNITIIVVNQITYVLPHNFVLLLGERLRIGVPIVFDGRVDTVGQIIIINVVQINNQVIVINPPRHHDEGEDDQGEDD